MTDRIEALDKLHHAHHLFEAVLMAIRDLDDRRQRAALDALLYDALGDMAAGMEIIDPPEPARMVGGDRNG